MKKYIAFHGQQNSGIQTKEKAHEWASIVMTKNNSIGTVHVCEVIETVERTTPPIVVRSFFTQLDEEIKAA